MSPRRTLRVGTRGSELARVQTEDVIAQLGKSFPDLNFEVVVIRTKGDEITAVPLHRMGDKGLFIKDIEQALLEGRIDFAVHSMKDVPSDVPEGLVLAATTRRIDPRDALISREATSLQDIPPGGTLATGSLRRRAQALALRPDLIIEDLRGNVPTRLQKFERSSWEAVILAAAGLERLGLSNRITAHIPTEDMLPAVGQGALALEAREEDHDLRHWLASLQDASSAIAVEAERAFLGRLEGGCQTPVAALGRVANRHLVLEAFLGTTDGTHYLRRRAEGEAAAARVLGVQLAEDMLAAGGGEILDRCRSGAEASRS